MAPWVIDLLRRHTGLRFDPSTHLEGRYGLLYLYLQEKWDRSVSGVFWLLTLLKVQWETPSYKWLLKVIKAYTVSFCGLCASTGMPSCIHTSICHIQTLICINELLTHVFPLIDSLLPFLPHLENTTWSLGPLIKYLFLFLIIAKIAFKRKHFPFYISL